MGSWNETCMISNLPIIEDESIIAFKIRACKPIRSLCYPDDLYEPITFPVKGKYDSYGDIKISDPESAVAKHFLSINDTLVFIKQNICLQYYVQQCICRAVYYYASS